MSNANRQGSRRVIVCGYGPVGRVVSSGLEEAGVDVTIIELNPDTVSRQSAAGKRIVHGDATDPAILQSAGLDAADALIVAVPDEDRALKVCQVVRQLSPDIFIAVRTNFLSKGLLAARAGANEVIVEEVVTAEAMQKAVMSRLLGEARQSD